MTILVARFCTFSIVSKSDNDVGIKLDLHILSVALQSFNINFKKHTTQTFIKFLLIIPNSYVLLIFH